MSIGSRPRPHKPQKVKSSFNVGLLTVTIFLTMVSYGASVSGYQEESVLWEGQYYYYELALQKGDDLKVNLSVDWDELCDIYIMTYPEVEKLRDNESFKAEVYKERVNNVTFEWHQDKDETYYLVIDNTDNARENDAPALSEITYSIEYEEISHAGSRTLKLLLIASVVTLLVCAVGVYIAFKVKR